MIKVEVWADVNPTEKVELVEEAVRNIIDIADLEVPDSDDRVSGQGGVDALRHLHALLRSEQILDTARTQLYVGLDATGTSTQIRINKQVATVKRLNFPAQKESLGSIHVRIRADDEKEMETLADWLAPPTEDGTPLYEIDMPENE
ncbi:MAG: RNA-binding domain-containing protein [Euryarchaeota archaeon]|nr:RNA-binding domain-containing protein [Euryarchaeota archaeon]